MPKSSRSRKPSVTIIGPGRLGTALAIALARSGYPLKSLVGRRLSTAKKAARHLDNPTQVLAGNKIQERSLGDLVILATPDDQLEHVAKELAQVHRGPKRRLTAVHTSGALSSRVLDELENRGWATASMHPLISVSDAISGGSAFEGAFWCIEGKASAVKLCRALVHELKGFSFTINPTAKALYHAAAVMSAGNVVALFDVAIDMLEKCGLTRREAQRVLVPLLESTVANLASRVPNKALTGPFARGDLNTVERHLAALSGEALLQAREVYRLLGGKSVELAKQNGLDERLQEKIETQLKL